jgi:hypothetical protein
VSPPDTACPLDGGSDAPCEGSPQPSGAGVLSVGLLGSGLLTAGGSQRAERLVLRPPLRARPRCAYTQGGPVSVGHSGKTL